jgi:hypothetical protein
MKFKKLFQLSAVIVLSLSSLLAIGIPEALAATDTWTGTDCATNCNWNDANNWEADAVPSTGDILTFPTGLSNSDSYNPVDNIPYNSGAFILGGIQFSGSSSSPGYDITNTSGAALYVHGNIVDSSTLNGVNNDIDSDIVMTLNTSVIHGTNQALMIGNINNPGTDTLTSTLGSSQGIDIGDQVDVYSNVTGNYIIILIGSTYFEADNSFNGTVGLSDNSTLYADSANTFADAQIIKTSGSTGATVSGDANLGTNIDIESGNTVSPGDPAPGCLTSTNLTIASGGTYDVLLGDSDSANPPTACNDYDQLSASGSITLGGTLDVSLASGYTPVAGQSFTIVNNTGTTALSGTFSNGSTVTVDGTVFNITYPNNNVVLTVASTSSSSGSSSSKAPKTPDTGLAAFKSNPIIVMVITLASVAVIAYANKKLKVAKK